MRATKRPTMTVVITEDANGVRHLREHAQRLNEYIDFLEQCINDWKENSKRDSDPYELLKRQNEALIDLIKRMDLSRPYKVIITNPRESELSELREMLEND